MMRVQIDRSKNQQAIVDQLKLQFADDDEDIIWNTAMKLEVKLFVSARSRDLYQSQADCLVNSLFEHGSILVGMSLRSERAVVFLETSLDASVKKANRTENESRNKDRLGALSDAASLLLRNDIRHRTPAMNMPRNFSASMSSRTTARAVAINQPRRNMVVVTATGRQGCWCKKTHCLKKYCVCFAKMAYCDPNVCSCEYCHNTVAFKTQFQTENSPVVSVVEHERIFCKCKRTRCLKLYCDCRAAKIPCSELCSCNDCNNTTEDREAMAIPNPISLRRE